MRTSAIGIIAIVLLASACATPGTTSDGGTTGQELLPLVATSPVTEAPDAPTPTADAPVAPPEETVASGDQQADDSDFEGQEPTVTTQPPEGNRVEPIQPVEPHPSGLAAAAIADLAVRLGIDDSGVTLVSQESVTWPDGSLGCPQPGMAYAQVLVSGSLVVLQVNGVIFEYHSGGGNDLFYCATPTPPVPGESGDA